MIKNSLKHNKVERVPFHYYTSITLSSGAGSMNLQPSSFPRLGIVADTYALYRFTEVAYRIRDGAGTSDQVVSYLPGAVDTPPAANAANSEALNSVILGVGETVPSDWARLKWLDLKGYLPWYKTVVGTPDPIDEIQGAFFATGTGAETVKVEFRGVCEFITPVNNGSTPQSRLQAIYARERDRMLRLFATTQKPMTLGSLPSKDLGGDLKH